ncbi:carbohydrate kinase family protein [uncultured Bosea sp.]|uniref:carbohydrate kinase family protein n=1 Tax=uncultured Bosea sp. TaxID=211457 RepID=UPI0025E7A96A|nr:carbohydrate kinase family protein [uncultured Bosea sp.]
MSAGRDLVLSIGRLYCDIVFRGLDAMPRLGEERFAETVAIVPGGGGFITAAHLAALGTRAGLLARIGTDPLSGTLAPALADSGVDLRWLEHSSEAGPQPTVVMVQDGERAFLSRRAGSARPATLDAALADPAARHLHIAEFATLAEIPDLIEAAKRTGLTVSLDPSWDDDWIRRPDLIERAAGADIFLPNAAEARAIAGCEDLDQAGSHLTRHFPVVVVKDGGNGARLFQNATTFALPAPEGGPVLDTTGAGDAFNAGFLAAWLDGHSLQQGLAEGIACGTLSVRSVGGAGTRLHRADVDAMSRNLLHSLDRIDA